MSHSESASVFTVSAFTALLWQRVNSRGPCGGAVNTSPLLSTSRQAVITRFTLGPCVTEETLCLSSSLSLFFHPLITLCFHRKNRGEPQPQTAVRGVYFCFLPDIILRFKQERSHVCAQERRLIFRRCRELSG